MPERLAAVGELVDDDVERRRGDAGGETARGDRPLAQREVVGEHLDPGPGDRGEPALVGSTPFWTRNRVTSLPSRARPVATS